MSIPTFHPFPKLPPELRLAIWGKALRPVGTCEKEIHYIATKGPYAYDDPQHLPSTPTWPRFHMVGSSAYQWDGGMRLACRESRHIWSESRLSSKEFIKHVSDGYLDDTASRSGPIRFTSADLKAWFGGDILCVPAEAGLLRKIVDDKSITENVGIAIEFDPKWTTDLVDNAVNPCRVRPLLSAICHIMRNSHKFLSGFYLIDRHSGVPVKKEGCLWEDVGHIGRSYAYDQDMEYIYSDFECYCEPDQHSSVSLARFWLTLCDWYITCRYQHLSTRRRRRSLDFDLEQMESFTIILGPWKLFPAMLKPGSGCS